MAEVGGVVAPRAVSVLLVEDDAELCAAVTMALELSGHRVQSVNTAEAAKLLLETGQPVGWIEGFKAVTDLYAPFAGTFEGGNPELVKEIKLVQTDPSGRGWLYSLRGTPGQGCLDVAGYVMVLDATIDKMLGKRHES